MNHDLDEYSLTSLHCGARTTEKSQKHWVSNVPSYGYQGAGAAESGPARVVPRLSHI